MKTRLVVGLIVAITWGTALLPELATAQVLTSQVLSRGHVALNRGNYDDAEALANEVLRFNPHNLQALALLASALEHKREYRKAVLAYDSMAARQPDTADVFDRRGAMQFMLGNFKEAIADFDHAIELDDKLAAAHWRRGIALYLAGRYVDAAAQFASGQKAFENDVENALWQFASIARTSGLEEARAKMPALGSDPRVPMKELYGYYMGQATPQVVMKALESGGAQAEDLVERQMYAHLYLGMYADVSGEKEQARKILGVLVEKLPLPGNYMWEVGRVYYDQLRAADAAK